MDSKPSFRQYFCDVAPTLLQEYVRLSKARKDYPALAECVGVEGHLPRKLRRAGCGHAHRHTVGLDRAVPLWYPDEPEFTVPFFWYSWYFYDLLDQTIHHHFHDRYASWTASSGGYPVAMLPGGLAHWQVARPHRLLGRLGFRMGEWANACGVFLGRLGEALPEVGIDPEEFLRTLLTDEDFNVRGRRTAGRGPAEKAGDLPGEDLLNLRENRSLRRTGHEAVLAEYIERFLAERRNGHEG
jgi:hypothetical protein